MSSCGWDGAHMHPFVRRIQHEVAAKINSESMIAFEGNFVLDRNVILTLRLTDELSETAAHL